MICVLQIICVKAVSNVVIKMYTCTLIILFMIILLYNDALKTTCNVMIYVSEDEQVYNIQNLMLNTFLQSKAFGYRIYEKTSQQGTWNFLLIYCTCM